MVEIATLIVFAAFGYGIMDSRTVHQLHPLQHHLPHGYHSRTVAWYAEVGTHQRLPVIGGCGVAANPAHSGIYVYSQ